MKTLLLLVVLCFGALVAAGCGDDPSCATSKCAHPGEGGSGGGDGGSGGTEDGAWHEVRPEACTEEQGRLVVSTNLFQDVFEVVVSPRLEPGFSQDATVQGYEENMTVILLRTASGTNVRIKWPGVIGDFATGERITLEQTRDWTILRKQDRPFLAAMYKRNGEVAPAQLEPLPLGGPALRFAMQCNMSDSSACVLDAVSLQAGEGANLQTFESGTIVTAGRWTISNRSALQSDGCPGNVAFRSLIWAHGGE